MPSLGRSFHEQQIIFLREFCSLLNRDLSLRRVLLDKITLVPDEHYDYSLFGVVMDLFEPVLSIFEGGVISDVVEEQSSYGFSVMTRE